MKGFTLALVCLMLGESAFAQPSVHTYDSDQLVARQVSPDSTSTSISATTTDCLEKSTGRVLLGGRQNANAFGGGGGRFGQGGGGRFGGGQFGQGGGGQFGGGQFGGGGDGNNNNNNAVGNAGNNNSGNGGNNNGGNNNAGGDNNAADDGGNKGDNTGADKDQNNGNAAVPVAANENGSPGPAVPVLTFTGGTRLNPAVLQKTEANANATANQAASATSNNNFIDFCVGQTITNGLQNKAGSCNPVPIGQIPSTQNMISTMFVSPRNMETIQAGNTFTIGLQTSGMTMGSFVNAQKNYYAAPQQIDGSGQIVGHAHVVLQPMKAIDDPSILDPNTFTFFKGLDLGDVGGLSTIDVQGGVPAGAYRLCTIMSASNHQSVILPVAQRGAENTCSYFIAE